jgi:hypothetical protein
MDVGHPSLVFWLAQLPWAPVTPSSDGGTVAQVDAATPSPPLPVASPAPAAVLKPLAAEATPAAAPWMLKETASYRVTFGILGQVAEATLSFTPAAGAAALPLAISAVGSGNGAVLGFGRTDKRIESEIDARTFVGRRWTNVRSSDGKTTADTGEQPKLGSVSLLRKRTGERDLAESFTRTATILDPLSFLLSVRMVLPAAPTKYEILDGRALWIAELSAACPDPSSPWLLRMDGKVDPIYWNGSPDPERKSRVFSLLVTRDRFHTPVRLVVPFGVGEVVAELVRLERPEADVLREFVGGLLCRVSPHHRVCRGISRPWEKSPIFP